MRVKYKYIKITIAQRIRGLKSEQKYYIERISELDSIQYELAYTSTSFYELQVKREEYESIIDRLESRIRSLKNLSKNQNETLLNLKYKIIEENFEEIEVFKKLY